MATLGVLIAFAANQLLSRAALGHLRTDPLLFTAVRLASGAGVLALLLAARRSRPAGGSWSSALALLAYALAFSLAYVRIGAGSGALVQFAAVQATMIGWVVLRGDRPTRLQWIGLVLAFSGVAGLTAPGASAPDAAGAALMVAAGVAWGIYSLRGAGGEDPLTTTADNFLRCVPAMLPLLLLHGRGGLHAGAAGIWLAVASGAVASGLGYALWYAVVPDLGATRAAIVQLAVPVVAAVGGAGLLGERVTARLVVSGAAILIGVGVSVLPAARRTARAPPRGR